MLILLDSWLEIRNTTDMQQLPATILGHQPIVMVHEEKVDRKILVALGHWEISLSHMFAKKIRSSHANLTQRRKKTMNMVKCGTCGMHGKIFMQTMNIQNVLDKIVICWWRYYATRCCLYDMSAHARITSDLLHFHTNTCRSMSYTKSAKWRRRDNYNFNKYTLRENKQHNPGGRGLTSSFRVQHDFAYHW